MRPCCAKFAISLLQPQVSSTARSALKKHIARPIQRATMSSTCSRFAENLPKELPGDEPDDVLFHSVYGVRSVELNRPKKLNSLNGSMARKILPRLREWEKSQMANIIIMSGAGPKAFCAGGDVAELASQNATKEGQIDSANYFALEYKLDHLIATYSKPYIAVLDGITMGGGVGLSVHAPFRIATEKTVFAMPETTIGFFPDVGGSFFLPRMDGEIGTYLALTSERLLGSQVFYAGVASHYLDSSVLQSLITRLSELTFKDNATLDDRLRLIDSTISEFATPLPSPDSYEKAKYGNITGALRAAVDRCFQYNTVEEILTALKKESQAEDGMNEWAKATLKTIAMRSPTSLKVTLKQLRLGRRWSIGQTFVREHQMAARFMQHPDFTEGVTARLIKKPAETPQWKPAKLEEVTDILVDQFFTLPDGIEPQELLAPIQAGLKDYYDYPHAKYSLPRERMIRQTVDHLGARGRAVVMQEILMQWNNKPGVADKLNEVLDRNTVSIKADDVYADGIKWKDASKESKRSAKM